MKVIIRNFCLKECKYIEKKTILKKRHIYDNFSDFFCPSDDSDEE